MRVSWLPLTTEASEMQLQSTTGVAPVLANAASTSFFTGDFQSWKTCTSPSGRPRTLSKLPSSDRG